MSSLSGRDLWRLLETGPLVEDRRPLQINDLWRTFETGRLVEHGQPLQTNDLTIYRHNIDRYVNYLESRLDIDNNIRNALIKQARTIRPLGYINKLLNDEDFTPVKFAVVSGDMDLLDTILSLSNITSMNHPPYELEYVISKCLADSFEVFIRNYCNGRPDQSLKNTNFGAIVLYEAVENEKCDEAIINLINIALSYDAPLNMNGVYFDGTSSNPYPLCASLKREKYISEITQILLTHGAHPEYSGKTAKGKDYPPPLFYCHTPEAVYDLLRFSDIDINVPDPETGKTFLHEILSMKWISRPLNYKEIDIIKQLIKYDFNIDLHHKDFEGKSIFDDDNVSKGDLKIVLDIYDKFWERS